jgi:hypothetical protein
VSQLTIADRQIFWYRNLLRYWRKHGSRLAVATLRAVITLGMSLRLLAALVGSGPENTPLAEAVRAYVRVVSECTLQGPRRWRSDRQ